MEAKQLVDKLKGDEPVVALEKFLEDFETINDSKELIKTLLKESPNFEVILKLSVLKKWSKAEMTTIYDVLGSCLMSLPTDSDLESVGLHVTQYVLQNHSKNLQNLLSPINTNRSLIAALKVVTGMIVSSVIAATEVSRQLGLDKIEFVALAKKEEVRIHLLYFILAILNTNDVGCLRHFLGRSDRVTCVFEGLIHEPAEVVIQFLNLLRDVVLNIKISKTLKMGIFNYQTCKHLTALYFHNRNRKELPFSSEEIIEIKNALHGLMMPLCTDTKYGVIFREKENIISSGKVNNIHVYRILSTINYPWQFEEGRDLIANMLKACPDTAELFKKQLRHYFEPRDHFGFFSLCKLFMLIIETREPCKELEDMLQKNGSIKDFAFTIPFEKSKAVVLYMLDHSSYVVMHFGLLILISYFKKIQESLSKIEEKTYQNSEYKIQFKEKIMSEPEKLGISLNKLHSLWHKYIKEEPINSPTFKRECSSPYWILVDISQFLCIYSEIFGYKLVKRLFNPLNMLLKFNELSVNESLLESQLRINLLTLIHHGQKLNDFEAFGFIKDKSKEEEEEISINENLFITLVDIYCESSSSSLCSDELSESSSSSLSSDELRVELKDLCLLLLNSSLDCWGLSSYCKNFIEVWLDKINDTKDQKACTEFFAKVVSTSIRNMYLYLEVLIAMNTEIKGNESSTPLNILDVINQMDPSIEIEDNENVNLNGIKIPFCCLILGAVDVLKADPNVKLISYFMNVVDDYIHRLDHPEMLCKYLLDNNILSDEMKEYLTVWSTMQTLTRSIVFENEADPPSLGSELKVIFMGENIPSLSIFCNDFQNRLLDKKELEYIFRQLYVYIHSEYEISRKSKNKKLKFFVKLFRKLLKVTEVNFKFDEFFSLFEHLLSHAFTLRNYEPNSSNIIQKVLYDILCTVLERYPSLHLNIKPFLEKFISSLNNPLDEEHLLTVTQNYLDNYSQLTFDELERIAVTLLSWKMVSENYIHFLHKLFSLLKIHTSPSHQPSKNLISIVITKMIHTAKRKNISEEELQVYKIVSDFSQVFNIPIAVQNMDADDFKSILKSRLSNDTLIKILLHIDKPMVATLLEGIKSMKVHLCCQIPFILSVINGKEGDIHREEVRSYLIRIKEHLLQWTLNSASEMNDEYERLFAYMLQNDMFELEDVDQICNKFYNKEAETPHHILSLVPFFENLSMKYKNNNNNFDDIPHPYIQLLTILMRGIIKLYRKKDEESKFVKSVGDVILDILSRIEAKFMRKEFYDNKLWQSFVKKVLKETLTDFENGPKFLKCLIQLAKLIYSKRKKEESSVPPKFFYQMLRSHSQFIPLMLNHEGTNSIKEHLAHLQLTLVEVCHEVCEERHIPLLLGSYGATLSKCDQYILKILYLYEQKGYMTTLEPNLWGRAAIAHFTLSAGIDGNAEYKSPKVIQILPLIDFEMVVQTALNFNMELGMEPTTIVESTKPTLYDQRFLLSLFLHFTTIDHLNIMNLVEKGIVAVGVAALTSHSEEVWAVGARLLQYVATAFQNSNFQNLKLQWMWLIGVLGYGLEGKRQRVPSITSHFIIRASQLILCPEDLMYRPVMNYLYLKPAFQLFKVPELFTFIYSDDVRNNKEHRAFLFDLLAQGIRDDGDFLMCKSLFVPKLILSVIKSPTVNTRLRVLALNVLNSMVRISLGAFTLVFDQSLLEELPHALHPNLLCPSDKQRYWIEAVVEILSSLWHTWKISRLDYESSESDVDANFGVKRKLDEALNNKSVTNLSPKKKRKLFNGQSLEEEEENDQSEEKSKISSKTEVGLVGILRCIGCIFSQVMSEGTIASILNVFGLLKEIIIYFEALEKEDRYYRDPIINSNFAKKQVKLWIENSEFVKRFQGSFTEEDAFYHGLVSGSSEQWRYTPLVKGGAVLLKEEYNEIKDMIQKRIELLDISNSFDIS